MNFLSDPIPFLKTVLESLSAAGIDVSEFELDHICYRVETLTRYEELKKELTKIGYLLTESEIGGRHIATFKLNNPIVFENRMIDVVELPSPKEGSFYPEGWEHVEFVIGQHPAKFIEQYPSLNFLTKGLSKKVNKDVVLKFESFAVKFHEYSLEYVIKYLD